MQSTAAQTKKQKAKRETKSNDDEILRKMQNKTEKGGRAKSKAKQDEHVCWFASDNAIAVELLLLSVSDRTEIGQVVNEKQD